MNGLTLPDFAFKNIDAQRIENLPLNGTPQGSRAVNGIVAFTREQCLGGIGQLERDLLLLETFRKSAKLNFDNFL